jgi:hypothetical protein
MRKEMPLGDKEKPTGERRLGCLNYACPSIKIRISGLRMQVCQYFLSM